MCGVRFKIGILCSLVILFLFFLFFNSKLENEKSKEILENNINKTQGKPQFNEKEKKIIDVIYSKLNIYDYFDRDNLKNFEITELRRVGYFESENNIHYIIVMYNSLCKDGTYDCDHLCIIDKKNSLETNNSFLFWIKLDVNTFDYIEKINGVSIPFNSDWKATTSKIE